MVLIMDYNLLINLRDPAYFAGHNDLAKCIAAPLYGHQLESSLFSVQYFDFFTSKKCSVLVIGTPN